MNVSRESFPPSHRQVMKDVSRYKATRNEAGLQRSAMRVSSSMLQCGMVTLMEGCFGVVMGLATFREASAWGSGAERGTGACRAKTRVTLGSKLRCLVFPVDNMVCISCIVA